VKQSKWTPLAILGCTALVSGWPIASHADDFTLGARWQWRAQPQPLYRIATHRRLARAHDWNLSVTPSQYGGVKLTFNMIVN
jgi:hypothetical protein